MYNAYIYSLIIGAFMITICGLMLIVLIWNFISNYRKNEQMSFQDAVVYGLINVAQVIGFTSGIVIGFSLV